jgi:hypothetical protein
MGAFYGSVLVRTEDSETVQRVLNQVAKEGDKRFFVGPALDGWISVFPNNSGQSDEVSAEIAKLIPHDIFHLIVHDDDMFIYYFYRKGTLVDQYNSCPDYFHEVPEEDKQVCMGRPELFRDLILDPESLNELKNLLAADKAEYTFEQERMTKFVELLGFSNALSSYEYLQSGEREGIKGWKQFVHIPDLTPEKNAKRAAQARIKAEKNRLQKAGVFLAEIEPPKRLKGNLGSSIAWGTDSTNNGLLLTWQTYYFTKSVDDEQSRTEFFSLAPPWKAPLQPLALKTNWKAHTFCMSRSGNWLAGGHAYGDWKMRVWDWRRRALSFEVEHTRAVGWVEFSQDEGWLYSLGGDELIVSSMAEKQPMIVVKGIEGARSAAVHPSRKFAVIAFQGGLGIIDLEKRELIKQLWINRKMETFDPFAETYKEGFVRSCLKEFLKNPNLMEKLGISSETRSEILRDPKAIGQLSIEAQRKIELLFEKVRARSRISFETKEKLFDVRFHPNGEKLFVASNGMRVFDWNALLSANGDAPAPKLSVDAPRDDETDPNSRPLAYCVRFDQDKNLLLSSCLAGVVQYLDLASGKSGVLLKPLGEMGIWRLELTSDKQALCCHCSDRPRAEDRNKRFTCVQVWNYPALCKAAGIA